MPDVPGHGDGATAVYQLMMAVVWSPLRVGSARPSRHRHPTHRSSGAKQRVTPARSSRAVAAVVEPLPEALAQGVAPGREGGGHGVLAGAAGEDGPADTAPGRSIVAGSIVFCLIAFWEGARLRHWWSHNQDAGWRPSQDVATRFQPIPTPVRGSGRHCGIDIVGHLRVNWLYHRRVFPAKPVVQEAELASGAARYRTNGPDRVWPRR